MAQTNIRYSLYINIAWEHELRYRARFLGIAVSSHIGFDPYQSYGTKHPVRVSLHGSEETVYSLLDWYDATRNDNSYAYSCTHRGL